MKYCHIPEDNCLRQHSIDQMIASIQTGWTTANSPATHIFIEDGCVAEFVLIRVIKLQIMFLHEALLKLLELLLYKTRNEEHHIFHCLQ